MNLKQPWNVKGGVWTEEEEERGFNPRNQRLPFPPGGTRPLTHPVSVTLPARLGTSSYLTL
jgi:hypothetical protein